ncbi:hypothetical protein BGZ81_003892, partial [Podila clonocystis]
MSQPSSFQFEPPEGPGSNFRQAPIPNVRSLVFQIESAHSVADPQILPNYSMATNTFSKGNDMDISYANQPTMIKLSNLSSYLEQQMKKEEESDDSDGSGAVEPMNIMDDNESDDPSLVK